MAEEINENGSQGQDELLADFARRTQEFLDARDGNMDLQGELEIDIADLIGATGQPLSSTILGGTARVSGDPSDEHRGATSNADLTANTVDPEWILSNESGAYEGCSERLVGRVFERKAGEAQKTLSLALRELREPIRTVAINCLFLGASPEQAARSFGTSIETIAFLTEVALDHLAQRIRIE